MTSAALAGVALERASMRSALADFGFVDDGEILRGSVNWEGPEGPATATIDVTLPARYPFGPPAVRIHHADVAPTFHVESDGALCLWETAAAARDSWTDAVKFLGRVAGWLKRTADGWPDDTDTDLERYLSAAKYDSLVLYDGDALADVTGCVRTERSGPSTVVVAAAGRPPALSRESKHGKKGRNGATSVPQHQQHLAFIADLGEVHTPIRDWYDLEIVLRGDAERVRHHIQQGAVELLLLRYTRGGAAGVLVLAVALETRQGPPVLRACEAADTSTTSRTLRAGPRATAFAASSVVIVGCGAIGSFIADMLFREGVREFVLIDPERYRPGNVIRHAAPASLTGTHKVNAVAKAMTTLELGEPQVEVSVERVNTAERALELVSVADLLIDATADDRATTLFEWAAQASGRRVISACVQREGGIARVDRFPLQPGESHLPAVPYEGDGPAPIRERGCGDLVSRTPVSAVMAAAELTVELIGDFLTPGRCPPPTLLRVLAPQRDAPFRDRVTFSAPSAEASSC